LVFLFVIFLIKISLSNCTWPNQIFISLKKEVASKTIFNIAGDLFEKTGCKGLFSEYFLN